jgi:hypothetical protein
MNTKILLVGALLAGAPAMAQVQTPTNQVPIGESRLPTESPAPQTGRAGGDDCRRQSQTVREQFQIQEQALRREMADRTRLASSDSERERIRNELTQRLASLKAEATEAERRVMSQCR